MASDNLTGFIFLNEIANFKGTPKKLAEFEERLKRQFPALGTKKFRRKINDAISKSGTGINTTHLSRFVSTKSDYLEY